MTGISDQDSAFEFDRATALSTDDGVTFAAAIEDGWDINGNANGGYLLALAAAAMRRTVDRPDPITITAHYLAPAPPAAVTISTEVVKAGRQLATATASMRQVTDRGEREVMRVLGSFGDMRSMAATAAGGFRSTVGAPPDLPDFDECVARSARIENESGTVTVGLMDRLGMALRPEHAGFQTGRRSGRAEVEGWFSFADGRPVDTLALLLAVDAFPPPVFNIDVPPGWVPTVELTVHVRAVPAPGPLRCRFHTEFAQHGFLQEDGEVWDSSGELVAQSRQLALVPRG